MVLKGQLSVLPFLKMAGKSQHLQPEWWFGYVRLQTHTYTHIHTLLHHLPGVGLLVGGQTDRPVDVSACVEFVKLMGVGETAALRGNRATHLKLCAGSLGQPLVDIQQAELIITANTHHTHREGVCCHSVCMYVS